MARRDQEQKTKTNKNSSNDCTCKQRMGYSSFVKARYECCGRTATLALAQCRKKNKQQQNSIFPGGQITCQYADYRILSLLSESNDLTATL